MFYTINRLISLAVFEFSDLNVNTAPKQEKPSIARFLSSKPPLSSLFICFVAKTKVAIYFHDSVASSSFHFALICGKQY